MSIQFLTNYPAVYIKEEKILAIADVQIGLEHELYKKGIYIHPQVPKFLKTLNQLIKLTKAKKLMILGDLKHQVPGINLRETRELPKFFDGLLGKVEIIFVKGNHDTDMGGIIPSEVKVFDGKGTKIRNYGFFHGHAWPLKEITKCDYIFMGHMQPAVEFKDSFGFRMLEQVWIKGKFEKKSFMKKYKIDETGELNLIVLPAFNPLLGSAIVNKKNKKEHGFLRKEVFNIGKSSAYLLDGTNLGKIRDLKKG